MATASLSFRPSGGASSSSGSGSVSGTGDAAERFAPIATSIRAIRYHGDRVQELTQQFKQLTARRADADADAAEDGESVEVELEAIVQKLYDIRIDADLHCADANNRLTAIANELARLSAPAPLLPLVSSTQSPAPASVVAAPLPVVVSSELPLTSAALAALLGPEPDSKSAASPATTAAASSTQQPSPHRVYQDRYTYELHLISETFESEWGSLCYYVRQYIERACSVSTHELDKWTATGIDPRPAPTPNRISAATAAAAGKIIVINPPSATAALDSKSEEKESYSLSASTQFTNHRTAAAGSTARPLPIGFRLLVINNTPPPVVPASPEVTNASRTTTEAGFSESKEWSRKPGAGLTHLMLARRDVSVDDWRLPLPASRQLHVPYEFNFDYTEYFALLFDELDGWGSRGEVVVTAEDKKLKHNSSVGATTTAASPPATVPSGGDEKSQPAAAATAAATASTSGSAAAASAGDVVTATAATSAAVDAFLTYGEVLPVSVRRVFDAAHLDGGGVMHTNTATLCELGIGLGKLAVQVYLTYPNLTSVIGVELSHGRYKEACDGLRKIVFANSPPANNTGSTVSANSSDARSAAAVTRTLTTLSDAKTPTLRLVETVPRIATAAAANTAAPAALASSATASVAASDTGSGSGVVTRTLEFRHQNLFDCVEAFTADIVVCQTCFPLAAYPALAEYFLKLKSGARLFTYLNLRQLYTWQGIVFDTYFTEYAAGERYLTSWSACGFEFHFYKKK